MGPHADGGFSRAHADKQMDLRLPDASKVSVPDYHQWTLLEAFDAEP